MDSQRGGKIRRNIRNNCSYPAGDQVPAAHIQGDALHQGGQGCRGGCQGGEASHRHL